MNRHCVSRKTWNLTLVFAAVMLTFRITVTRSAVIHVPVDQPTIQSAINLATTGDTVVVADGIYTGSAGFVVDYTGKNIVVISENGSLNCIIDGNLARRCVNFSNGETAGAILDGFTITHGYHVEWGGGVVCTNSAAPIIRNCRIEHNQSSEYPQPTVGHGAGIYIQNATPQVISCIIDDNVVDSPAEPQPQGGGVYLSAATVVLSDCVIQNNHTGAFGWGGGIYGSGCALTLTNCSLIANYSYVNGGAICLLDATCQISDCDFSGNQSTNWEGGAIYCERTDNALIERCSFTGNTAHQKGGACSFWSGSHQADVRNCIFKNNSAEFGGAINVKSGNDDFRFINCSFSNNNATASGGAAYFASAAGLSSAFINAVLWNNGPAEIAIDWSIPGLSLRFDHCDIKATECPTGTTCLDCLLMIDPRFINSSDCHLQPTSPCINAGTTIAAPSDDFDNEVRPDPYSGLVDIGADEFQPTMTPTVTPTPTMTPVPVMANTGIAILLVLLGGLVSSRSATHKRTVATQVVKRCTRTYRE